VGRKLGQGAEYRYSHEFPEGISGQEYLSRPLELFRPGSAGAEGQLAERLARWKSLRAELRRKEAGP
jgi:putative ATPase